MPLHNMRLLRKTSLSMSNGMYYNTDWHGSFTSRLYTNNLSLLKEKQAVTLKQCNPIQYQQTKLPCKNWSIHVRSITQPSSFPLENNVIQKDNHNASVLSKLLFSNWKRFHLSRNFSGFRKLMSRHFSLIDLNPDWYEEFAEENIEDQVQDIQPRRKRTSSKRYVIQDKKWAKTIYKKLKKQVDFNDENVVIVECNPDCGLLTRSLLLRTKVDVLCIQFGYNMICDEFQMLTVGYELQIVGHYTADYRGLYCFLQKLLNKRSFKKRLFYEKGPILELRRMLKKIGKLKDDSEGTGKCFKIIGTTFPSSLYSQFISLLSYDLGAQNHIYSLGYIDIFLFVPALELKILGLKNSNMLFNVGSLRSALYKIFFNTNVLLEIPSTAFRSHGNNKIVNGNVSPVYLIHLVPRPDIHEICEQKHIPRLISLVKELRKKRGKTVVSAIESMCTSTSPILEKHGFRASDKVSDLSVEQVLIIHQVLLARPDCLTFDLHEEEVDDNELQ